MELLKKEVAVPQHSFQFGDIVKVVGDDLDLEKGDIGVVVEVDGWDGTFKVFGSASKDYEWVEPGDIELKVAEQPSKGEITVGSKVRVVATSPFGAVGYKKGDILTVERLDGDGDIYAKDIGMVIFKDEVELVTEVPTADKKDNQYTIKLSESEMTVITSLMGKSSMTKDREFLSKAGITDNQYSSNIFYEQLSYALKEGGK